MAPDSSQTLRWLYQKQKFLMFSGLVLIWFSFTLLSTSNWTANVKRKWASSFAMKIKRSYDPEELDNSTCYGVTPDIAEKFDAVYSRTDCANVQTVVIDRLREIGFGYHFLTLSDTHVNLLKRGVMVLFEKPAWKYSTPECEGSSIDCTFQRVTPCQIKDIAPENLCRVDRKWGYPEDHWTACFEGTRGRLSDTHRALPQVRFWIRKLLHLSEGLLSQIQNAKHAAGWPASGTTVAIHIRQGQTDGPDHVRLGKRKWDLNLTATTAVALALKWRASAVLLVSDDHPLTEKVQQFSRDWALSDGRSDLLPKVMTTGSFAAGEVGLDCVRENYFRTKDCEKDHTLVRRQALSAMIDFFLPATEAQHFAGTMASEFSMGISYYMKELSPTIDLDATKCEKTQDGGKKCVLKPWATYRGRCTVPESEKACVQLKGVPVTVCV